MLGELWCSGLLEFRDDMTFQSPGLGQNLMFGRLRESKHESGVFDGGGCLLRLLLRIRPYPLAKESLMTLFAAS